ncbi:hypothetical protein SEA_NEOS5_42 [Mycobacterium phage Neos5]|uniref:DUF7257 domain-containing protein n=5 Tax=Pipefishvirus TaxID=1982899 RepID=V5RAI3_9CAUD|nr:virion structural protein [Mycobacterium phage Phaedrus]YP_002564140.1 virion structural protein [Mycobacterium phage Phlyer]YP_008858969.1 virion structural protein [Mycobacterium phage Bernardo]YP_009011274.1 virion structural protein [Mycobacterium phage Gadjet]YP_009018552.1 virion structural protein [Mycobacterium phage Akoma]YP_010103831.1 virion structural protein [Mycobacterium phage Obutu]AEJ94714.1 hypothetical protein DAISY_42 [Mycobacterium phage Daisy]AER50173.1 hypothetical 
MPGLFLGDAPLRALWLGGDFLTSLVLTDDEGDPTTIWETSQYGDDFDRPDASTAGSNWTITAGANGSLGIVSKMARHTMPDGLIGNFVVQTARGRYIADMADQDDVVTEFRIGSQGSGDNLLGAKHPTTIFHRHSNSDFSSGVGVRLESSTLKIVRRVSSTETVMVTGDGFKAGDICRFKSAGNVHTLYRNGHLAADPWNDTGETAAKGASNRRIGLVVTASKDLLGPRRFSPGIDYIVSG